MQGNGTRKLFFKFCVSTAPLLLCSVFAQGQNAPATAPASGSEAATTTDLRALAGSIRELRDQLQVLNSQLSELRAEQQQDREESRTLRLELDHANRIAQSATSDTDAYTSRPPSRDPSQLSANSAAPDATAQDQTVRERLARLEEDQQLIHSELNEQSQTKVEAASKYRVRLSGIVLLSMFDNRGTVDDQEVPEIATPRQQFDSGGALGGSLRQSQVGIEVFGPELAGPAPVRT